MIPLLAALAMLASDVLAVPLVQAEAEYLAHRAAALDTMGWLVGIATTFLTVAALEGHDTAKKVAVVLSVSVANYVGTYLGVRLGKRFQKVDPQITELLAFRDRVVRLHPDLLEDAA